MNWTTKIALGLVLAIGISAPAAAQHDAVLYAGGMRIEASGQRAAGIGALRDGAAVHVDGVDLTLRGRKLNYGDTTLDLPEGQTLLVKSSGAGITIDVDTSNIASISEADALSMAGSDLPAEKLNDLGVQYMAGRGVEKDPARAIEFYRKAADKGSAPAQSNLAFILWNGEHVARDVPGAIAWARKAAEQGNTPAMWLIARSYDTGEGQEQDPAKAFEWYRKCGDQGDAACLNNIGTFYAEGKGVAKDDAAALQAFRRAADKGSSIALANLGEYYRDGVGGVDRDAEMALRYFEAAAKAGEERGVALYNDLALASGRSPFMTDGRTEPAKYWFRENDQNVGPLTLSAMEIAAMQLRVRAQDEVWTSTTKWQAANDYPELSWLF